MTARRASTAPAAEWAVCVALVEQDLLWASAPRRKLSMARTRQPGYSSMNTNKLLVAAVLATGVGAPIAVVAGEVRVAQPMASTGVRTPFLHGFPSGEARGRFSWLLSSAPRVAEFATRRRRFKLIGSAHLPEEESVP